ncbi:MAG: hypothetical protein HOP16_04730 [Acidobacteria bacterium]|nr:hypothetical protein [Acidobacteriota bacterium]
MPGSFRFFSSLGPLLIAIGTCSVLVCIVILITGGFVIDTGFLYLSALRWQRPFVFAGAAWILAALAYRQRGGLAEGVASLEPWLGQHSTALAVVISAAAAGAGIAFGTYAASGADAAGYVSQSELLASARVVLDEPLARLVEWPDATWAFSPLGYRPGTTAGTIVPAYPPGLPVFMAVSRAFGEWAPFVVVPLFGALAVFCSYAIGARLHSRTAGIVAAILLATSPVFLFQVVQPMSDVPATALWALALMLALRASSNAVLASGFAAGCALATRPNLLPLALVLAAISVGWPQRVISSPRHAFHLLRSLALGAMPPLLGLLLLQSHAYGNPLASGYGNFSDYFSLATVGTNIGDYARKLIRGEAPVICLALLSSVALAVARLRTHAPAGAITSSTLLVPAIRIAAIVAAALLVCYLPYGVYPDWSYLRFLLPAFPVAFVVVGSLVTSSCSTLPRPARGLTLLVAMTMACSVNVEVARNEQAFNLRRYEARYRTVGRYLDAVLPRSAVVLSAQESASVHYYTHLPVLRWEFLRVSPDEAVATLTSLRRTPVLLVEDWEAADLRARFPASTLVALDWPARADVGSDTRVRLYYPGDRDRPSAVVTDRFGQY